MNGSAVDRWQERVRAHHQQMEQAQREADWNLGDEWAGFSEHFRHAVHGRTDRVAERILFGLDAQVTVIDVGGGAGRYALPLAQVASKVTVVEPSASMAERLERDAKQVELGNIEVVRATWEDAIVGGADVVVCANVLHGILDIEPFLRKLEAHAGERVIIVEPVVASAAVVAPFWEAARGEAFRPPPALPELIPVLWALDIWPDIEMLVTEPERAHSREEAVSMLRQLVYARSGDTYDRRLGAALDDLTVSGPDGISASVEGHSRRIAIITWIPGSMSTARPSINVNNVTESSLA